MSKVLNFMRLMRPEKIRLLPVLMGSAALLFGLKCTNIVTDMGYLISPAFAAQEAELGQIRPAAGAPAKAAPATTSDDLPDASAMSRSEIGLLQELSARRGELKQREAQLDMRERLLLATEKRVNDKIAALKQSEVQIKQLMGAHDQQEEVKIKSLVRVYENMKPKDAARILEKLDTDIMLEVVRRMSERKIAPVLAAMSADSAKALTTELATRKPLPLVEAGG